MIAQDIEVAILLIDGAILIIVKKVHHYNNYKIVRDFNKK